MEKFLIFYAPWIVLFLAIFSAFALGSKLK